MKKDENIKRYTAAELKAKRAESLTNWRQVDEMSDEALEAAIASDEDERGLAPDWTKAELVLPEAKQSVNLRLEKDVIDYFKSGGKGHIARMQAVLKAYADAHRPNRQ